jgi:tRNA-guanine family transglycosylase
VTGINSDGEFAFDITARAGDARAGRLTVNGTTVETPTLFPVLNFYAGGTEDSLFGGSIHRTLKEFIMGADAVDGVSLPEYFDGVMTSVASLTDYGLSKERYQSYLDVPIKEREMFSSLSGLIFIDSGGYKLMSERELDSTNLEFSLDQTGVYEVQHALGGDIIVNLDHPITPDDTHAERLEKAAETGANIRQFLSLTREFDGALYLTIQGYNYSMMDEFLDTITDEVPAGVLVEAFDGIALGGLVPKKDDRDALIQAVTDCRELMDEWDIGDWPLHVLGISSRAGPLLSAIGADTFDSSSHMYSAINGKYSKSLMETVSVDDADFASCDCPVCSSTYLVDRMRGNAEYQKDILGPVAMHNLIVQKRELAKVRESICQPGTAALVDYLEDLFRDDQTMRRFTHQVVNQSLGGYF